MLFGRSEKKPVEPVAPSFEDQLPTVILKILNLLFSLSNLVTRISPGI
jgi:hypothetical protein